MPEKQTNPIGRIIGWFTNPREWTKKTHSTLQYTQAVRIYDKWSSPANTLAAWLFALAIMAVCFGSPYWGLVVNPPTTNPQWAARLLATPFLGAIGSITLLFALKGLENWYDRHWNPKECNECGETTVYAHVFNEHYDIGKRRKYYFCSTDCRMAWERKYVEYDFSGYYDIQSKGDEDRVRYDNYSSAYYTDGEPPDL